jgi:hypothetical protein
VHFLPKKALHRERKYTSKYLCPRSRARRPCLLRSTKVGCVVACFFGFLLFFIGNPFADATAKFRPSLAIIESYTDNSVQPPTDYEEVDYGFLTSGTDRNSGQNFDTTLYNVVVSESTDFTKPATVETSFAGQGQEQEESYEGFSAVETSPTPAQPTVIEPVARKPVC